MADPADLVTLKLIFWHNGKQPGELIEVRRDAVRSWYGFAVEVDATEEAAKTADPAKAEETAPEAPAAASKTPAKPSTAK